MERRTPRRRPPTRSGLILLAGLVLAAIPVYSDAAPGPKDLDDLLARFSRMPGFEARYEEEKHVALLARPLRSEGRLYFLPPSTLLRRVTAPGAQDIRITPGAITIEDGNGRQVIDLESRGAVRPLVESLLWLFAGDRGALEGAYAIRFEAAGGDGEAHWRLTLAPRDERIARLVEQIVISGEGFGAEEVAVEEAGGDGSILRVRDANPNRHFDAEERAALFGAPTAATVPEAGDE